MERNQTLYTELFGSSKERRQEGSREGNDRGEQEMVGPRIMLQGIFVRQLSFAFCDDQNGEKNAHVPTSEGTVTR